MHAQSTDRRGFPAPFVELGALLASRWAKHDFDELRFPDLATEELSRARLHERCTPEEVLAWGSRGVFPVQWDARSSFGEPPLTIFDHPRFVIDVYTWFSSSTSIHQHAFSGAFGVLHGGSVQSRYQFERRHRVHARLFTGDLTFLEARVLSPGSVEPIRAGSADIHTLFHLEHPSLSVVVRTKEQSESLPQFQYLNPGLAFDPFYDPVHLRRRLECLLALSRWNPEGSFRAVLEFVEEADPLETWNLASRLFRRLLGHPDQLEQLRSLVSTRYPTVGPVLVSALDELVRTEWIVSLRRSITEPDLRCLLAFLLTVPSKQHVFDLVRDHFHESTPSSWVRDRLMTLVANGRLQVRFDETQQRVIELLLDRPLEQAIEALKETYCEDDVEAQRASLESFAAKMRRQPLFDRLLVA